MKFIILVIVFLVIVGNCMCKADCVYGAQSKTKFVVIDSHTILLSGGTGPDILIKTFAFVTSSSRITILKDSFCSYESDVLLIDGSTEDVNQVTKL